MKPLNLERATRILALISATAEILLVTLTPVNAGLMSAHTRKGPFTGAEFLENLCYLDFGDVVQNIALFLPFGFLVATFLPAGRSEARLLALTCLIGICLSGSVETLQTWIPGRYPTLSDVLLNGLG